MCSSVSCSSESKLSFNPMRSILNNIRVSIYNVAFPMDHVNGSIIKPLRPGSYPASRLGTSEKALKCHPSQVIHALDPPGYSHFP